MSDLLMRLRRHWQQNADDRKEYAAGTVSIVLIMPIVTLCLVISLFKLVDDHNHARDLAAVEASHAPLLGAMAASRGPIPLSKEGPGEPYDDPHPLQCSRITYTGVGINSTIEFVVPAGWSVWRCIKERFDWDDQEMVGSIDYLKLRIAHDPTLEVRDPNVVPVHYSFIMGGDGAGPVPLM